MSDAPRFPPLSDLRRRRSAKWRTHPRDVLPMGIAEMDVDLAPAVRDALGAALADSDTGYAAADGELGDALAGFARQRWGWVLDAADVIAVPDVGVGVVETLRCLAASLGVAPTVAFSPPVYPPFHDWVAEVGAREVRVPLVRDARGWSLDLDRLDAAFATGVDAYLLCNPHNPVGVAHSADDLAALVALAHRHGVWLVGDEIHAPLALTPGCFTPLLTVPGAAEVAVALTSASKAWNLTGLKCAALVSGSARGRALLARLPPDARWRAGHLGQVASVAAYREGGAWLDGLLDALRGKCDRLEAALAGRLAPLTWRRPQATYLAWLDTRAIDGDVAEMLLREQRLAVEPGRRFGPPGEGHIRLNIATADAILDDAIDRLAAVVGRHRP